MIFPPDTECKEPDETSKITAPVMGENLGWEDVWQKAKRALGVNVRRFIALIVRGMFT